jgi:hypothetical protein
MSKGGLEKKCEHFCFEFRWQGYAVRLVTRRGNKIQSTGRVILFELMRQEFNSSLKETQLRVIELKNNQ